MFLFTAAEFENQLPSSWDGDTVFEFSSRKLSPCGQESMHQRSFRHAWCVCGQLGRKLKGMRICREEVETNYSPYFDFNGFIFVATFIQGCCPHSLAVIRFLETTSKVCYARSREVDLVARYLSKHAKKTNPNSWISCNA